MIRSLIASMLALSTGAAAAAATYDVGSGKPYASLAALPALAPGDLVQVWSGTYHEVKRWQQSGTGAAPITIRGMGATRPIIDAAGLTVDGSLPNPRGAFQVEGSWITVENFELRNASNTHNGASIRITSFGSPTDYVTIRGCRLHDCDTGFMNDSTDHTLVDGCEIDHNGATAGYSHNMYLGGTATTLRGCWVHDSTSGINVKSRAHYTEILYSLIADSQDGEIDLVDEAVTGTANSNALLLGNLIVSKDRGTGWNSARFIHWGQDNGLAHTGTLYAINNTMVAGTANIQFIWNNSADASAVATNNIFYGSANITSGNDGPVGGGHNWMPTGATAAGFTSSIFGSAPGFVAAGTRDYRLTSTSACRGISLAAPTSKDGSGTSLSGVPTLMYSGVNNLVARPSDGALDAGAYEYGSGTTTGGTTTGVTTTGGTTTGGTTVGSGTTITGGSASGGGGGSSDCGLGGGLGLLLGLTVAALRRRR